MLILMIVYNAINLAQSMFWKLRRPSKSCKSLTMF